MEQYKVRYAEEATKLFRIDGPNPPPYFARGCQEAGRAIAHLEDSKVTYEIKPVDMHMIRAFSSAVRVLDKLQTEKPSSIDSTVQEA